MNKTIAHRDQGDLEELPTWADLDAVIDLLADLVRKYNELLDAGEAPGLVPTWQTDWKEIFRKPWLSANASASAAREEKSE